MQTPRLELLLQTFITWEESWASYISLETQLIPIGGDLHKAPTSLEKRKQRRSFNAWKTTANYFGLKRMLFRKCTRIHDAALQFKWWSTIVLSDLWMTILSMYIIWLDTLKLTVFCLRTSSVAFLCEILGTSRGACCQVFRLHYMFFYQPSSLLCQFWDEI